jgi:uncharacterized protein (DUF2384 family)
MDGEAPTVGRPRWKRSPVAVLSTDQKERQSRVIAAAFAALASPEAVRDFLNAHDGELDARPIDLAVQSAAGANAVEKILERRAAALIGR